MKIFHSSFCRQPPLPKVQSNLPKKRRNKWETEQTRVRSVKAHHKKARNRSRCRKTVKSSLPPPPPMSFDCKMFFNYSLNALQLQHCCTCEKACSIQSGVNFSYLLEPRHVSLAHCHFQLWWEFEISLCHVIILCPSESKKLELDFRATQARARRLRSHWSLSIFFTCITHEFALISHKSL